MKLTNFFSSLKLRLKLFKLSLALKRHITHHYFLFFVLIILFNVITIILAVMVRPKPEAVVIQQQWHIERSNLHSIEKSLNDVSLNLTAIEAALKSSPSKDNLNLPTFITQISGVPANMLSSSQRLQNQLDILQQQLNRLRQHAVQPGFLPASVLPFTVLQIDNIQGKVVVTVMFNHISLPLMQGDSLAGFSLISVDVATQTAIFENAAYQRVLVNLKK